MTFFTPLATRNHRSIPRRLKPTSFSLVEVVVATGICTYALLVLASLLPVGLTAIRTANQQVVKTEIYNQIWSELSSTSFYNIVNNNYPRLQGNANDPTYYDNNGNETNSSSAIFIVRCTMPQTPALALTNANEMTAVEVQIGYHVDPQTAVANDPRVSSRTFTVVRRDGSTTSSATPSWGW
jgi:uncharacterized protein (TIGR02598 family)